LTNFSLLKEKLYLIDWNGKRFGEKDIQHICNKEETINSTKMKFKMQFFMITFSTSQFASFSIKISKFKQISKK